MARPPAPKPSFARRFRQVLAGFTALASLWMLLFALLRWRMNTPEQHLEFGHVINGQLSGQSHE